MATLALQQNGRHTPNNVKGGNRGRGRGGEGRGEVERGGACPEKTPNYRSPLSRSTQTT